LAVVDTLKVLAPGLLTTVQDTGRFGYGRYGVAPSGALDRYALRAANLLVDNPETAAGLEITLAGFGAEALVDAAVAITGGDLKPRINGKIVGSWRSHRLKKGDRLQFGTAETGCRAYLAVGGSIAVAPVMGSRSTNLGSGFGGFEGRGLRTGDILRSESPVLHLRSAGRQFCRTDLPPYADYRCLRVLPGPQQDQFSDAGWNVFLRSVYTVSPQSDRTGIRLSGPAVEFRAGVAESIVSEGIIDGAIQVPGDGQPIIVLSETVSGGYRKIATVVAADLHRLGQLAPGHRVQFQPVSRSEALEALWRLEESLTRFRSRFG
jgi:antagonist of KipI